MGRGLTPCRVTTERPTFNDPVLREQIRRLREVDNVTNLGYLALEYGCLVAVMGAAIAFAEHRAGWGLAWGWNVPVFLLAIVLLGGLLHRLAGLGHESSHYTLLHNKWANDLLGDVLCMFPILTTIHFYRVFHMAHHQYTNDPERDPDIVNLGHSKKVDAFPMPRLRFILTYYVRMVLMPVFLARYAWDYIYVNVLGKGGNIYMKRVPEGDADYGGLRLGTILGLLYIVGFIVVQWAITTKGDARWLIPAGLIGTALAGWSRMPCPPGRCFSRRSASRIRRGSPGSCGWVITRPCWWSWASCGRRPAGVRRRTSSCSGSCRCPRRSRSSCSCATCTSTPTPTMAA